MRCPSHVTVTYACTVCGLSLVVVKSPKCAGVQYLHCLWTGARIQMTECGCTVFFVSVLCVCRSGVWLLLKGHFILFHIVQVLCCSWGASGCYLGWLVGCSGFPLRHTHGNPGDRLLSIEMSLDQVRAGGRKIEVLPNDLRISV